MTQLLNKAEYIRNQASKIPGPFKRGDVVHVEDRDGLHPTKYTVKGYAGHGFWKVRPQRKGALTLDLPQSRLVFA